jgi:hypothetical protein
MDLLKLSLSLLLPLAQIAECGEYYEDRVHVLGNSGSDEYSTSAKVLQWYN